MLLKQKGTRTQITNLADVAVELSDREMRIVSGGILASIFACSPRNIPIKDSHGLRAGTLNDSDHDFE